MDRRAFVKTLGIAGGIGAAFSGSALAATVESGDVAARSAMLSLLDTLHDVQGRYLSADYGITAAADIAEGERFLLHVLETGLHFWLEADPERPLFKPYVTPTRKLLGDNPDALYFFAPIRGDRAYRIRGNLAGATFTSFTVEGGGGDGGNAARSISALDDDQLICDRDGNFEILLSAEKPAFGNWLKLEPGASQVTTRHYFEATVPVAADPSVRIPLRIEALAPPPLPPARGDAEIAQRIDAVGRFVRAMTVEQPQPKQLPPIPWVSRLPNRFNAPGQWLGESAYGNLHAHYASAPYVLAPDEALVIEGRFPTCRFANVMLWNRFMQTYDFLHRQVSLNRAQIRLNENGGYRLVVAHRDPGLPNWLDTEQRPSGMIYWRFLLAKGEVPTPQARVVKFSALQGLG